MKKIHCGVICVQHFLQRHKILIIMKLTVFLICLFSLSVQAKGYSQSATVSLDIKEVPLKAVFKMIEKQTQCRFFYNDQFVELETKVSFKANDISVDEVLNTILKDANLTYKLLDNNLIVIAPIDEQAKNTITGIVTDAQTGESLPGVTILIKGTTKGTLTDNQGKFSLINSNPNAILVVSLMGYEKQEIAINNTSRLTIKLVASIQKLDEVVVVGYGQQKKQSVVGAISTAKGSDLAKAGGLTNISSALTGLIPGLVTQNAVGKPGNDQADIYIRGQSTWNNTSPLILVDGIERDMNNIDANEIENVSVLKDASATAVFGVRGANGVILITTKRGKSGKAVFKFGANTTMKQISKMPTYADSYESRLLRNEVIEIQTPANVASWAYYTPYDILMHYKNQDEPYLFPNVDWRKETMKDAAWSQNYNLEVSGGTDFVKYFSAISYMHDGDIIKTQDFGQGYVPAEDYTRLNFRTNLDFQPTKTTTFSVDIDGSQGKNNFSTYAGGRIWGGIWGKAPDMYPVRYADGNFAWSSVVDPRNDNPVYGINFEGISFTTTNDVNATFKLNQKLDMITTGLSLTAIGSFHSVYSTNGVLGSNARQLEYIDPYTGIVEITNPADYTKLTNGFNYTPLVSTITPEAISDAGVRQIMYTASLNYNRSFGKQTIGGLINFKRQQNTSGNAFASYREEWAGRLTYDYDSRYLLETNVGYNGSEQFGPGYKFGLFPSYAVGWNLGNEEFFKKSVKFINKMKFRFSTGTVGNDNAGSSRWLYVSSWAYAGSQLFGNVNPSASPYIIANQTNIGNPEIRWETAKKNDFAIETAFFKNLITFNFDYYWGHRKDIFMSAAQRNIAPWFGASPVAANIGETKDHGYEIEAGFNKTTSFGLRYYINLSLSYSKNTVVYMEDPELTPDYQKKAGFPIGQQRSTLSSGLINNWDQMYTGVMGLNNSTSLPGDYRFVDYNADGVIDSKDGVPYGYPSIPEIVNNYTFGLDYKGFSVMMQLYSTRDCTVDQNLTIWGNQYMDQSVERIVLDNSWLPGRVGSANLNRANWNFTSAGSGQFNKVDGTLWRIKKAEIAYTFSGRSLKKFGIDNLRIYVNGNDLYLWSHLNEDRERNIVRDLNITNGVDFYPMTKTINFGMNITF